MDSAGTMRLQLAPWRRGGEGGGPRLVVEEGGAERAAQEMKRRERAPDVGAARGEGVRAKWIGRGREEVRDGRRGEVGGSRDENGR